MLPFQVRTPGMTGETQEGFLEEVLIAEQVKRSP